MHACMHALVWAWVQWAWAHTALFSPLYTLVSGTQQTMSVVDTPAHVARARGHLHIEGIFATSLVGGIGILPCVSFHRDAWKAWAHTWNVHTQLHGQGTPVRCFGKCAVNSYCHGMLTCCMPQVTGALRRIGPEQCSTSSPGADSLCMDEHAEQRRSGAGAGGWHYFCHYGKYTESCAQQ